jgi:hypothetical protein
MTLDSQQNFLTLDAIQQLLENAADRTGCRHCPRFTSFEQQLHLEILEHRFGGEPERDELEDEEQQTERRS